MSFEHAPRCSGTNRKGQPCKNPAMRGTNYCRNHGGKNKRGTEHPNFKHGRYTNPDHLPKFMRERFDPNLTPQQIVDLRVEIAHQEQLRDFALDNMRQLQETIIEFDPSNMVGTLLAIRDQDKLIANWHNKAEVANTNLARMKAQQVAIREKLQQFVTADEAQALVALLGEAIKDEVDDPVVLEAIELRFGTLLNAGN